MKRKVIQQGPSTLMVSLPSKWIKENNVKKGDEIDIDIQNNQLTISSKEFFKNKTTEITLSSKEQYLDRVLMSKYREGYNKVLVHYDDPAMINNIKKTLTYLLGFEIVDQDKKSCTIQNISEGSDDDYPKMFRRMFQIMVSMAETCQEYVETRDEKLLTTVLEQRETLIKLEQFNLRVINKETSFSLNKKSLEYFYVWHITTFGKTWSSMAKKVLPEIGKLTDKEKDFFDRVVKYARTFYEKFYTKKEENLRLLKQELYDLRPIGKELFKKSDHEFMIYYLMRLVNRMYETTQLYEF